MLRIKLRLDIVLLLFLCVAALPLLAQPPQVINSSDIIRNAPVKLNSNFSSLYYGKVGRWFSSGPPGNFPFSLRGDLAYDTVSQHTYACFAAAATPCTAVAASNWVRIDAVTGVTSVGLTVPSWLSVAGSPVTSSGTLAVSATTGQTAHQVIGTCGATTSFAPCALVAGDLPNAGVFTGDSVSTFPVLTLNTVNSNVGSFGDATHAGQFTVNAKGLITAAASIVITPAIGSVTGLGTGVATALGNATNASGGVCTVGGGGCAAISGLTTNKIPKATSGTTIGDSSISDNGTTVSTTEGLALGSSPPSVTFGTGGGIAPAEGTAPSVGCPAVGVDCVYADSTAHALLASLNNGSFFALTQTIASGQTAIPVTALAGNSCDAAATTATATGALTTDAPTVAYASDPTGVTGYGGGTSGGITIRAWTTANTFNFKRCNETGGSITPGALNLNWRILR